MSDKKLTKADTPGASTKCWGSCRLYWWLRGLLPSLCPWKLTLPFCHQQHSSGREEGEAAGETCISELVSVDYLGLWNAVGLKSTSTNMFIWSKFTRRHHHCGSHWVSNWKEKAVICNSCKWTRELTMKNVCAFSGDPIKLDQIKGQNTPRTGREMFCIQGKVAPGISLLVLSKHYWRRLRSEGRLNGKPPEGWQLLLKETTTDHWLMRLSVWCTSKFDQSTVGQAWGWEKASFSAPCWTT